MAATGLFQVAMLAVQCLEAIVRSEMSRTGSPTESEITAQVLQALEPFYSLLHLLQPRYPALGGVVELLLRHGADSGGATSEDAAWQAGLRALFLADDR